MAAEAALDRVPPPRPSRAPLSRRQVESLLSRAAAAFSLVFFIQTFLVGLAQVSHGHEQRQWTQLVALLLMLTIAATCVSALLQRWVRLSSGAFAAVYLLAVLTWPLASRTALEPADGTHWLYYLLTVSTALAAIALPARVAGLYLLVAPTAYAVAGYITSRGGTTREQAILEAVFSILLGGAILVIITMLRQAATAVDHAQAAAFESYAEAVRQHATEIERVQVDSIVHDSVLTTLLSAARASTPEAQSLVARMAGDAIGHLQQAALLGPIEGAAVSTAAIARRVAATAQTVGAAFDVRVRSLPAGVMPAAAADALWSAATQAMVNSVQHAGDGASRWLEIRGHGPAGLVVEVGDDGCGFLAAEVSTERLGLRVSVLERVVAAGGGAEIDAQPGEGTVITLRWPARGDDA
jgi:signal transduction histidine kinase